MHTFKVATLALAALLSHSAWAGEYAFKLHNKAPGYNIVGFSTYQDGQWSKNWLDKGDRIRPGQSVSMDWNSDGGDCVVPFRVTWENYGSEQFKLDWCKGVHNVYMLEQGFRWD
jgi:hypothetical protein